MNVIEEIRAERARQIDVEGWTPEHDDSHAGSEMAKAAAWYALPKGNRLWLDAIGQTVWPEEWDDAWQKPTTRRRDLIKAAALLVAEIERIDRRNHLSAVPGGEQ